MADCLKAIREEDEAVKQRNITIEVEKVKTTLKRMSNWKAPAPNPIWYRASGSNFTTFHERIAEQFQVCLELHG